MSPQNTHTQSHKFVFDLENEKKYFMKWKTFQFHFHRYDMLNGDYYDDNGDGYDEKSIHNCQRLSFACAMALIFIFIQFPQTEYIE